ncbi:hypothetical protein ACFLWS_02915 [Chloroflexota bacterium]
MGWFSKSCPLEEYWKHQNVPFGDMSSSFFKTALKDRCPSCEFWQDAKCKYKQMIAEKERLGMRGYPALIKGTVMDKPRELRTQFEQAALKYSGLNSKEQQEYWSISKAYDSFWDEASPDQRQEILDCLHYLQLYLEDGLGTVEANQKVLEWLKENEVRE